MVTVMAGRPPARRLARWIGAAIALLGAVAGLASLLFLPWGNGPDGVLLGFELFSYVGDNSFLVPDLHPLTRFYLEGMPSMVVVVALGCLVLTAGVRAAWARWLTAGLALVAALCLLLSAAGKVATAGDPFYASEADVLTAQAGFLIGGAGVVLAAAVALALRRHRVYDWFAVAVAGLLGPVHLWSVHQLSAEPATELRLTVLAWTPALWFLLAAVGAAVAAIGAGAPVASAGAPVAHTGAPVASA